LWLNLKQNDCMLRELAYGVDQFMDIEDGWSMREDRV
jgi:hypothetical protein